MNSDTLREYNELLMSLPLSDAFEWMDDCRSMEIKLNEMKRIYGGE